LAVYNIHFLDKSVAFEINAQPINRDLKMKCQTDNTININLSEIEKVPNIADLKSTYDLLGKETQGVPDSVAAVLARAEKVGSINIRLPDTSVSVASIMDIYKKFI
jgi:hypothetical protein